MAAASKSQTGQSTDIHSQLQRLQGQDSSVSPSSEIASPRHGALWGLFYWFLVPCRDKIPGPKLHEEKSILPSSLSGLSHRSMRSLSHHIRSQEAERHLSAPLLSSLYLLSSSGPQIMGSVKGVLIGFLATPPWPRMRWRDA